MVFLPSCFLFWFCKFLLFYFILWAFHSSPLLFYCVGGIWWMATKLSLLISSLAIWWFWWFIFKLIVLPQFRIITLLAGVTAVRLIWKLSSLDPPSLFPPLISFSSASLNFSFITFFLCSNWFDFVMFLYSPFHSMWLKLALKLANLPICRLNMKTSTFLIKPQSFHSFVAHIECIICLPSSTTCLKLVQISLFGSLYSFSHTSFICSMIMTRNCRCYFCYNLLFSFLWLLCCCCFLPLR